MIAIANLEIHVTHGCNLTCESCSHYSNYGLSGRLTAADADRQFGLWSQRIRPRLFGLLGGEPTLNPELSAIVEIAATHWSQSQIQLITNGFLLSRHPQLPAVLAATGTRLEISVHHESESYQQRLQPVRELVAQWESDHSITVNWRSSHTRWRRAYRGHGDTMRPYSDNDPSASWSVCPCKYCPQILDGRLYKCPPVAYLPTLKRRVNLSSEWSPYLRYSGLNPDCTRDELAAFFLRKSESVCGMCPAHTELFVLPDPQLN